MKRLTTRLTRGSRSDPLFSEAGIERPVGTQLCDRQRRRFPAQRSTKQDAAIGQKRKFGWPALNFGHPVRTQQRVSTLAEVGIERAVGIEAGDEQFRAARVRGRIEAWLYSHTGHEDLAVGLRGDIGRSRFESTAGSPADDPA